MKRAIAIILLMCMGLSLCACGKSKEAQTIDALILSIEEVTLKDKETINKAQEQYDALSDRQKKQVENYSILEKAVKTLAILEEEEAKRKEEEAKIRKNYQQVLQWIAKNGEEILEEDDINEYGKVKEYSCYFENESGGWIRISFELDENGKYSAGTTLLVERSETPREMNMGTGTIYTLYHYLYLYMPEPRVEYLWKYGQWLGGSIASGWLNVDEVSQMSRSKTDYEISNYKEDYNFKSVS